MGRRLAGWVCCDRMFARRPSIRDLPRLCKFYGKGSWRKRKRASVPNATIPAAEIHWSEASGIGKKEIKIKRFVD